MSLFDTMKEKLAGVFASAKVKLAITSVSLIGLVQYASADLNSSIYPILADVVLLFVPLLALIIAVVPLVIAIAIIGFILGILDGILKMLHI